MGKKNNNSILVTLPEQYRIYDPNKLFKEDDRYFDEATKKISMDISTKDHVKKIINKIWLSNESEFPKIISDYIKDNNCDFDLSIEESDLANEKLILILHEKGSSVKYRFIIEGK
jgi:hypothetical protein